MSNDILRKIEAAINDYQQDFLSDLCESLEFDSSLKEAIPGCAFGKDMDDCLTHALAIAKKLGAHTIYKDSDGYYGYADFGEGEQLLGVLCHLDIVPAGSLEAWDSPPFKPTIKGGKLFARGSQDDKGPSFAALYALKIVQDLGIKLGHRIRFIFGVDEENLWRCIKKYLEYEEIPDGAFTPDSTFPLINAEKMLVQAYLTGKGSSEISLNIDGVLNAVPEKAIYTGPLSNALEEKLLELNFEHQRIGDNIVVIGQSAHSASSDKKGINALKRLCHALYQIGINHPAIDLIGNELFDDPYAIPIFGEVKDEFSGALTFNVAKLYIDEKQSKIGVDVRAPVTLKKSEYLERIENYALKKGFEYVEYDFLDSIYVPKDNPLVGTLCYCFTKVTGQNSEPLSSGGATYARSIPNCVAFGAILPGREKTEHMPNEHIVIEDIMTAMKVYAFSFYKLQEERL